MDIQNLIDAVVRQGADIAPTYNEYLQLAFALATDLGEAGRNAFHRLCSPSPKYRQADADKMYTAALRDNRGEVHLGTAYHLARQAGISIDMPAENLQNLHSLQLTQNLTHRRAYHIIGKDNAAPAVAGSEETLAGSEPAVALPAFAPYAWPRLLAESCNQGATPAQRDVLLLAAITAIGACMGNQVRCKYGRKYHSPCLQLFVVAPPASGKGVLSFTRKFAEQLHRERRQQTEREMEAYRKEKTAFEAMGKKRAEVDPPQPPKNRLFIIPGNNTGTGILQNIIDSDGHAIIFEPEADTISTAIGSDYGHWSDTLRKAFDHEPLTYNRRTDREYREVHRSFVSVILSGTPAQVRPLIPSAENGLFSRQLFYYMPAIHQWQNQFEWKDDGMEALFDTLAQEWKGQLDRMRKEGAFDVVLTTEQQDEFNRLFAALFRRSVGSSGNELNSSVARLGIIACRILSVVGILRMLEGGKSCKDYALAHPAPDIARDNLKDGIITRWEVGVAPEDFKAVLALVPVLYRHTTHILSFLPDTEISRRPNFDRNAFFALLPETFSRCEMLDTAAAQGIKPSRADSWLHRLRQKGMVELTSKAGIYHKCPGMEI